MKPMQPRLALPSVNLRKGAMGAAMIAAFLVGSLIIPAKFFDPATQELVSFLSLIMAGVLPTAVLSATILRAGGLSVRTIGNFRDALIRQLKIWAGFFIVALTANLLIIFGKTVGWSLVVDIPFLPGSSTYHQINFIGLVNGVIVSCLTLLSWRTLEIFNGIRSLVIMSADIAFSEAQAREHLSSTLQQDEVLPEREGFGARVPLAPPQ